MICLPWKQPFFTLLVNIWLVLSVIFSGIFVIEEHDHEHIDASGHSLPSGEGCHICLELQITQAIIEAFSLLNVNMVVTGIIVYTHTSVKPRMFFPSRNLGALKVRFNC
jgi:Ni,Fe-hydrogenase I cytochrome b subunit